MSYQTKEMTWKHLKCISLREKPIMLKATHYMIATIYFEKDNTARRWLKIINGCQDGVEMNRWST